MITSADAVLMLSVPGVFDVPQQIQQFSADDVYQTDPVTIAETAMGVDGVLTAGYVPNPTLQRIMLMADSPSADFFEQWFRANRTARTVYEAYGTTFLNSLGKKYDMYFGVLTTQQILPDAGRTLRPRTFTLTWQRVSVGVA